MTVFKSLTSNGSTVLIPYKGIAGAEILEEEVSIELTNGSTWSFAPGFPDTLMSCLANLETFL